MQILIIRSFSFDSLKKIVNFDPRNQKLGKHNIRPFFIIYKVVDYGRRVEKEKRRRV